MGVMSSMSSMNRQAQDGFTAIKYSVCGTVSGISFVFFGNNAFWNLSLKTFYSYTATKRKFIEEMLEIMKYNNKEQLDIIAGAIDFGSDGQYLHKLYDTNHEERKSHILVSSLKAYGAECSICSEPILNLRNVAVGACKHFFHRSCIQTWFLYGSNCPMCRGVGGFRYPTTDEADLAEDVVEHIISRILEGK